MITYGLCGRSLKHSYSRIIHGYLGNGEYRLINLEKDEFYELMETRMFKAVNVTIPYKKDAFKLCNVVSDAAKSIGSVNTVVNKKGVLYGYNTDYAGFVYMLKRAGIDLKDKHVLILGTGGTSLTANAAAKDLGAASITTVSRSGKVNYQNVYELTDTQVVINTTPVGMYPDNGRSPIDLARFPSLCGVADVIYNPLKTKLLLDAQSLGVPNTGGLPMLVYQAVKAHELFFDAALPEEKTEEVLAKCLFDAANIVLVGMPGCGKTSVGKALSRLTGRTLLDTDVFIEQSGMKISEIFEKYGEGVFRQKETEALKMLCSLSGKIIASGGGAVTVAQNKNLMRQNGIVVYIKRELSRLATENRPLSAGGINRVEELYGQRKELYEEFCDISVDTDEDIEGCAQRIVSLVKDNVMSLCPGKEA